MIRSNDFLLKWIASLYLVVMPVVSVFVTEVTGLLFVPIGLLLDFIMSEEQIKLFSSFFGMCGGFLIFLGGFWYVRKMISESRKEKYGAMKAEIEERKAQHELRIKELEREDKELDLKTKEKELYLFDLAKQKMNLEEDEDHKQRQLRILELDLKIKELERLKNENNT